MSPITTPVISLSSPIACARGSMKRAKRMGLRGHPCRHPLSRNIVLDKSPFILILAVGEEYREFKHLFTWSLKPKQLRTKYKYSHRTESKAFSASRLITTDSISVSHMVNEVESPLTLSWVCLFFTKPVWSVSIKSGIVFSNCFASIDAYNL